MAERLVLVIYPLLMDAMKREVTRLAEAEFSVDADGATHVQVLRVRDPDSLTDGDKDLLGIVKDVRFVEPHPFILPLPPRDPRREQADHMARLRKFTGKDWRGRRG